MKALFSYRYLLSVFAVAAICLCFTGCALFQKKTHIAKKPALVKLKKTKFPEFFDDRCFDGLEISILQSLSYLNRLPSSKKFRFGEEVFAASHMITSLERFLSFIKTKPSGDELKKFIRSNCLVYKATGKNKSGDVLFTGYYEPVLSGSLEKTPVFRFPVYSCPDDLAVIDLSLFSSGFKGQRIIGRFTGRTVVPYHDRKKIEKEGMLEKSAVPLAWVDDRIDLFFLQIQGSGKICLDNDKLINVHYHTSNGQPYRSIGKLLVDEGKIPRSEISMQKIRKYLTDHPEEVDSILNHNPSYIFFKIEKEGPIGYLEVKLTPGRSLAVDNKMFPMSALAFVETKKPVIDGDGRIANWMDCNRFVLNQDTGGAIRGPARADMFWGNGKYAEVAAGHMQHFGKLYFLVLKPE